MAPIHSGRDTILTTWHWGGYLAASGTDSEGLPALAGATIADSAGGGMHAAIAIIAALVKRLQSGEGAYLDVSCN